MTGNVNWSELFPGVGIEVLFSNLAVPAAVEYPVDTQIASLLLPGGVLVDVDWDAVSEEFVVSVFQDSFRSNRLQHSCCDTPERVIHIVRRVVES